MGGYRGGGDLEGRIGSGPETEQVQSTYGVGTEWTRDRAGTYHRWSGYRVDHSPTPCHTTLHPHTHTPTNPLGPNHPLVRFVYSLVTIEWSAGANQGVLG